MNKIDVKVVELHKQEFKGFQASHLMLELRGDTVNSTVVNTLRRLALDYVPTYAFTKETIDIEENTSIFDNDYMKLRISQVTVPQLKVPVSYLPEKYWKDIDYADPERERHPSDKSNLELYINKVNAGTDVLNVTTNDVVLLNNGEEMQRFDKKLPLLITQLRPKEVFKCHARAALGLGKRNDIWAAAANSWYEDVDPNRYKFSVETQGQMDEYEILYKACDVLKNKLTEIKGVINDKYNVSDITKGKRLTFRLDGEDHTTANIINEFLQINPNVAFAGLSKPDLLREETVIKFMTVKENPIKPLVETVDFVIELYSNIQKQIQKLGGKFITSV